MSDQSSGGVAGSADDRLYRFGPYELDSRRRLLCRAGSPVALTPKAFDVLLFLVQNPNRPVTKEDLLHGVWGRTIVEEGNLTQYVSHLRKALGEDPEHPSLIATIPRKGYQFTGHVVAGTALELAAHVARQRPETEIALADQRQDRAATSDRKVTPAGWRKAIVATIALAATLLAIVVLYRSYDHGMTLSAAETFVLADLDNQTSDPVLDDALNAALRLELEQTPYVDILDVDKEYAALGALQLPRTTKATPDVARQICLRTHSNRVIAASIADAGNRYRLGIRALDCNSEAIDVVVEEDINSRNEIIHGLGVAGARLRAKLREPADSLARFNQSPEKALSASLEALQDDAQGSKVYLAGDVDGALKLFQQAVEKDPNFALAHGHLGAAYQYLRKADLSAASYTRAYELRDRLTDRGRFAAEVNFYTYVLGDIEQDYSSALRWLKAFPRDVTARAAVRSAFVHLGEPSLAADEAAEIARLRPTPYYFGAAIQSIRFASRFNEAKEWITEADALHFDNSLIRRERLIVAFATQDGENVEQILKTEAQGKYADDFAFEHSLIEIQRGHFHSAEHLRVQAMERPTKPANGDWWLILSALENAEVGMDVQASRYASKADPGKLDGGDKAGFALALARCGLTEEASRLADQISSEKPTDTLVQRYLVPTIRAAVELRQHDPAAAIELLREATRYDLALTGSFESVYPAYLRGLAYRELGDGKSAAAQFQKQIDNPGFSVRHVIGPLAWLQLGRVQKMAGDAAAARKSYETFLGLWADADPDIPIYREAKVEYAEMQRAN
jgi:DNA-binding winged helix-turn-helix (wHTH) protein/predicted TIM-barrel fold metal-dependent hydrolase